MAATSPTTKSSPLTSTPMSTVTTPPSITTSVMSSVQNSPADLSSEDFLLSVVVIHSVIHQPDYAAPWDKKDPEQARGSGFIIRDPRSEDGRLIVTNAHCVEDAADILVQRYQSDEKHPAKLLRIITDCDVAVLHVEDNAFWRIPDDAPAAARMTRLPPLAFGPLPKLQDRVRVVGYPEFGSEISVTQGVVSRIQHQEYVHSGVELLSAQTTAQINSGNSGGPVVNEKNELVGIAFQGNDRVGEFIPNCVYDRFLQIEENAKLGQIISVAGLSFCWQTLENKIMRTALGLDAMEGNNKTGIYVTSVLNFGSIAGILEVDDVIVEIEGVNVGNKGTIIFNGNRVGFMHLVTSRAVGDSIHVGVVRHASRIDLTWTLSSIDSSSLVPKYDKMKALGLDPDYLVIGGLVFVSLSQQSLECMEETSSPSALVHMADKMRFGKKTNESEECVVLSKLLPNDVAAGYDMSELQGAIVRTFNSESINSLSNLAKLYEACEEEYIRIGLSTPSYPSTSLVILDHEKVLENEQTILGTYRIPAPSRIGGRMDGEDEADEEDPRPNMLVQMNETGNMVVQIVPCQECGFQPDLGEEGDMSDD